MTTENTEKAMDYLSKELVVARNIVTFRSLSRALGIHVNEAKNELARYHTTFIDTPDAAHATYLITGTPKRAERKYDGMEVDDVGDDEYDNADVEETKISLVSEAALDDAKEEYEKISSCYVYSLSPSPIREPALICEPNSIIREAEKQNGRDFALVVGRITGPHVKLRARKYKGTATISAAASSSKSKSKFPALQKPVVAKPVKQESKVKEQSNEKDKGKLTEKDKEEEKAKDDKPPPKPKPTGKLDFSKASAKPKPAPAPKPDPKPKVQPQPQKEEEEEGEEESQPKAQDSKPKFGPPKRRPSGRASEAEEAGDKPAKAEPKRGIKRKSVIQFSDSDDDAPSPASAPPSSKPSSRGTSKSTTTIGRVKRAVLSSDEDEDEAPKPEPKDDERADNDAMAVDEDFEPAIKAKPKRKLKKEIPVGKNGLKKKRVVKQKMTMDEKGYMVTMDYSEYESVDEEVPEEPVREKGRKKAPSKEGAAGRGLKPSEPKGKKVAGQRSLKTFFGK